MHLLLLQSCLLILNTAAYLRSPSDKVSFLQDQSDLINNLDFLAKSAVKNVQSSLKQAADNLLQASTEFKDAANEAKNSADAWTITSLPEIPHVKLRTKTTSKLCDPDVKQIVGYLDVQHDSHADHFFFWFFESRHKPAKDPLVLWLNGGPGCSSLTGLLMELGPCKVNPGGQDTTYNPHSWNNKANMIFLDQPVNAGFSWTDGDAVSSSEDAASDVYAFLQLFLSQNKKFAKLDFHITGESYAGHSIGQAILEGNANIANSNNDVIKINLVGLAIGNGLTDPLVQYEYFPDMACNNTYAPILSEQSCNEMRGKFGTCQRLIQACYQYSNRFACVPASIYCNNAMIGPVQKSGVNVYDVRTKCEEGNPLCYGIIRDIEAFMNSPDVQAVVGVDREFKGCNMDVNLKFLMNGDWMKPFVKLVPGILDAGVRILVYAGDADFICNWMGNKAWTLAMDWPGHDGFNAAEDIHWKGAKTGRSAGVYRRFEGLTFLQVFDAGHMVPYDQPEHSSEFFDDWIKSSEK